MSSEQHVLIIGAGACGLAMAQGLQKNGIPFTIFEAEEESTFRPREWTMAFHWGIPMLEHLLPDSLAARLTDEASVDRTLDYSEYPNNTVRVYDGVSGSVWREIIADDRIVRVSRRKLRAFLHQGIDVKYGHTLQTVAENNDGTVTASFANGSDYTGTILVGSEGPRSVVRKHLFGPDNGTAAPLPITYLNVAFRYPDAEKARFVRTAHPVVSFAIHPDCSVLVSMQDVPDPKDPETWRFQTVVTWSGHRDQSLSNAEKHDALRKKVANVAEPFRSAILWMPEDLEIQYSDLSCWIPEQWDSKNGRITLSGDAAHSMPPNRGQGLNHAINDAYNFVNAVKTIVAGDGNKAEVIQAYSDEVAQRGAKEAQLSKDTAFLTLDYSKFTDSGMMRHGLTRMPEEQGPGAKPSK